MWTPKRRTWILALRVKIHFLAKIAKNGFLTRKAKIQVRRLGVQTQSKPFFLKFSKNSEILDYFTYLHQLDRQFGSKYMETSNLMKTGQSRSIYTYFSPDPGFSQILPKNGQKLVKIEFFSKKIIFFQKATLCWKNESVKSFSKKSISRVRGLPAGTRGYPRVRG